MMRGRFVPLVPQRLPRSQVKSISGPAASCTGDFYHSREMRSSGSGVGGDAHHLWTAEGRSGSRRFQQLANAGYQLISAEGLLEIIQAGEIQAVILASPAPTPNATNNARRSGFSFLMAIARAHPFPSASAIPVMSSLIVPQFHCLHPAEGISPRPSPGDP